VGETIFGVMDGRADMGYQPLSFSSGTFPLWDFGSIPFLFENIQEFEKMINDPDMIKIMEKTYADAGLVKLVDLTNNRTDGVWGNKRVATVADFEGLKVRTTGMLTTFALQQLGASAISIATAEVQEALLRGTVDAVQTSIGYGLTVGMADFCTYLNLWSFAPSYPGAVIANKKSFDALPADLQAILMDVSRQMQGEMFYAADVYYRTAKIAAAATKLEIVEAEKAETDKVRELTKPVVDKWLEGAGPYGPELLTIVEKYAWKGIPKLGE
jgi:TRAP-type C4-dicarboxylate transport system substrate-binding protein